MIAQSTISPTRAPINWKVLRPCVGVAFFACEIALRAIPEEHRRIIGIVEVCFFVSMCAASALLAYQSSRSFAARQTARRVWIIIALMPLADAFAYFAYNYPAYTSSHQRSKELIAISTVLLSLSRVLAAVAFWSMFRVYRKTGLTLSLRTREYLAMGTIMLIEVIAQSFSHAGARASGGPDLARIVLITAAPNVIALVPCSVLGVMIWRYTTQMGGGLVAKAWRNTLLYAMGWLSWTAFHAVIAYYLQLSPNKIAVSATTHFLLYTGVDILLLKAGEYLMFLGASFQYEACTAAPDFSEELREFGSEVSTPA
jgi:hypothetical protein